MSQKWYPVIDDSKCTKCGTCVNKCTHGVYDKEKNPSPFVVFAEGCIDGCHGCGSICPSGAINYFGETV